MSGGEEERVAMLWRGPWSRGVWRADQAMDFHLAKGVLEGLAAREGAGVRLEPATAAHLHPGVCARVLWQGEDIGTLGRLHPEVAARYELDEVYLAELRLPLRVERIRFRDVPRQPFAERDLAVIAPEGVAYAELRALVEGAAGDRLESLSPFDVYRGDPVPAGMRSVALRFRFREPDRALTDAEVDEDMANVMRAVRDAGYDIRA